MSSASQTDPQRLIGLPVDSRAGPVASHHESCAMNSISEPLAQDERVTRAVEEYLAAWETGRRPNRSEFLAQHGEIADALADCLDGLDFIRSAAPDLRQETGPDTQGDASQPEGPLGDFRIVREIGRGGMGVVYEAEQISLGRRVALKVLPFASTLDSKQLQRFKNEAQAAAHLHHTNIVPVFATGCERGVHYYAMQFIEGHTLASIIADLRAQARRAQNPTGERSTAAAEEPAAPAPPAPDSWATLAGVVGEPPVALASSPTHAIAGFSTESSTKDARIFQSVATLGIQAAEALEHAHEFGVIHRDIKPANLMVQTEPGASGPRLRLWITDFGLAHCQNQVGLTITGDLMGTLRYMSPEQALAKRVPIDHRTDIYSLGVTLYEFLTLEPVFPGRDRQELLRQIAFEEPLPPRRRNKRIPAELETIVLKAMEKNPVDRYGTAQELADDLKRFLEHKPIRARRASVVQRGKKWARRHQGVVATATAALVVLILALAVSNVMIMREKDQKVDALNKQEVALQEKEAALITARQNELTARRRYYAAQMNLAQQAWEAGNPARVLDLLEGQRPGREEIDLRSFEWYYLWRLCHQGDHLRLKTPNTRATCLAFSPDGKTLAAGYWDGSVRLWDPATGRLQAISKSDGGEVASLAFAPNSRALLIVTLHGSVNVKRWDLVTDREIALLVGRRGTVWSMALSPDGTTLATGMEDGTVTLWNPATLHEQGTLAGHKEAVYCLAFSPDGKNLGTSSAWGEDNGRIIVYDLASRSASRLPTVGAYGMEFSWDSQWLALSGNEAAPPRLFEVATGQQHLAFERHAGLVYTVAFAPDGKSVATGGNDHTVRLYDARTGEQHASYPDAGPIYAVRFSPDGRTLASAGHDGTITLRDVTPVRHDLTLPDAGKAVAFAPDGKTLASTGAAGLKLWDVLTWKETASFPFSGPSEPEESVAFTHDGKTLAVAHYRTLKLFDLAPLRERASLDGPKVFWCVAFSPDDKTLASASKWVPYVSLRDPGTLQEQSTFTPDPEAWARICAFSPDGTLVATGSQYGVLKLFDVATGQVRAVLQPGEPHASQWVGYAAFSPDGKLLASSDRQGTVKLWDVATGKMRAALKGHVDAVDTLGFSTDGGTLASGGQDRTVKLWDVMTGQERMTLKGFKAAVRSVAFAHYDSLLAAASEDGTVKIWRAAKDAEATARKTGLGAK
jgi:WD40 repeat protein/serine/threonine protein kinase